ncbi:hypothetical protein DFJ73DRAFT_910882 [Zopfochytrium polystomum]|nr:hypothetical protein DFJ73DRAFT_910882 [Zopfochytrium polystomum]
MMDHINYLFHMHEANIEPANLPTIQTLSSTFGCTWKRIASIGFVVRNDMQDAFPPAPFVDNTHAGDGEKRFWAIAHAYPHLTRILRDSGRYTLLRNYYGATRGTYFSRKNMSYYQDVVAGAGWFALGIAVGFTSPLISPGLNAICTPTASLAASLTARQLGAAEVAAAAAAEYTAAMRKQIQALHETDLLLYSIFRHPRLFHAAFYLHFLRVGVEASQKARGSSGSVGDATQALSGLGPAQNGTGGAGGDGSDAPSSSSAELTGATWASSVVALISNGNGAREDLSDDVLRRVELLCTRFKQVALRDNRILTRYAGMMRYFDDALNVVPDKGVRYDPILPAVNCRACAFGNSVRTAAAAGCVLCGAALPPYRAVPLSARGAA